MLRMPLLITKWECMTDTAGAVPPCAALLLWETITSSSSSSSSLPSSHYLWHFLQFSLYSFISLAQGWQGLDQGNVCWYHPWIPSHIWENVFFANLTTQVIIKCGGMKNQDSQPTKLDNLWQCRGDLQESRKDEQSNRQAPYQGPHTPHRPPDPHPPWTHDLSSFTFQSISPSQDAHIPQTSSRFRDHPP